MQFELYEDTVIYTGESIGAILEPKEGTWLPFCYFENGEMQIYVDYGFKTPEDAVYEAKNYFS